MHLSCKVIKNVNICENGNVQIDTSIPLRIIDEEDNLEELDGNFLEEYEEIKAKSKEMIKNAKERANSILQQANEEKEKILYDAKEAGFKQGYDEGNEIGYREGYEKVFSESTEKAEAIIENANYVLYQAKEEYDKYLKEKEMDIRNIIITSVENMLKKEFENEASLDELLFNIINEEKKNKMFLIRVAPSYVAHLDEELKNFKEEMGIKGEIIVLQDKNLKDGDILIEKDNGKTSFTINDSLEKLKEALMEV